MFSAWDSSSSTRNCPVTDIYGLRNPDEPKPLCGWLREICVRVFLLRSFSSLLHTRFPLSCLRFYGTPEALLGAAHHLSAFSWLRLRSPGACASAWSPTEDRASGRLCVPVFVWQGSSGSSVRGRRKSQIRGTSLIWSPVCWKLLGCASACALPPSCHGPGLL